MPSVQGFVLAFPYTWNVLGSEFLESLENNISTPLLLHLLFSDELKGDTYILY